MIDQLNMAGATWADRLWIASVQAVIVVGVAWLVTVFAPRISPRVRCWIWRLAYLKIALSLFWTSPIELALLPSPVRPSATLAEVLPEEQPQQPSRSETSEPAAESDPNEADPATITSDEVQPAELPLELDHRLNDASDEAASVNSTDANLPLAPPVNPPLERAESIAGPPAVDNAAPAPVQWPAYLLLVWLVGLVAVVVWLAIDALRAARLLRGSQPLTGDRWLALSAEVCRLLNLRRPIPLRVSAAARSPVLIRFLRPTIVLPAPLVEAPMPATGSSTSEPDIRSQLALAIAHEAAHLRRHDLTWNALAAVVHVLLYFHPAIWLAHRRMRLEQEMACDELVLQKLSAAPQDYGRMLLSTVRRLAAL